MKKFTLILSILFLFSLTGCAEKEAISVTQATTAPTVSSEVPATTEAEEPTTTPAPTTEVTIPPQTQEPVPEKTVIETKYYSLTLPDHWKETCFYSIFDETTVTLRENASYEAFGGGKLCTLRLVPTNDDTYKDFPSYELLAALDTPDGSFYVIALFPTDVQFSDETMDSYNTMADELMDVLYTLQPNEGIEMAMP